MQLNERKLQILQAVIDDYIESGEPVGSRTIAKKYGMGISSATIRNEMADLEEMGYLEQPHTSAGRIPSDKAYRLYVDRLMKVKSLSVREAELIKKLYAKKIGKIEEVIVRTAKILSDITSYTSVVLGPQMNRVLIKHIHLVSVDSGYALLVIVTNSGIIRDTLVPLPEEIDSEYLNRISNILTDRFKDKTFKEIDLKVVPEIEKDFSRYREFFNSLIDALTENLAVQENDIYLEGTANIFNFPEYHDIIKAKEFLSLVEDKSLLYDLLSGIVKEGVSVIIGTENKIEKMKEYSVVTASYKIGDRILGTIGVIGPTRMEYSKTVSIMDFVGRNLSQYLTRFFR